MAWKMSVIFVMPFKFHSARGRNSTRKKKVQQREVTRRYREVIHFTRSRVKNNSKLTNLMEMIRIEGYNGK